MDRKPFCADCWTEEGQLNEIETRESYGPIRYQCLKCHAKAKVAESHETLLERIVELEKRVAALEDRTVPPLSHSKETA